MNFMNANQSPGQKTGGGQSQQNPTSRDRSILNGGNAQSGAGGVLNSAQQVDPRLGGYGHDGGDLGGTSPSRQRAAGARSPMRPAGVHTALPVGHDFHGYMPEDHDEIAIEAKRFWKRARLANAPLGLGQASISRNNSGSHLIESVSPAIPLGPGTDPPPAPDMRLPPQQRQKYVDSNVPDRFEQFILGEGEKKVVAKADTRTPNSAIFTFAKEDHTLANLLKCALMKDTRVLFSGYKVAHPLVPNFELRIQTDGTVTPKEVLVQVCRSIVLNLDTLSREFTKEFELRKIVTDATKE